MISNIYTSEKGGMEGGVSTLLNPPSPVRFARGLLPLCAFSQQLLSFLTPLAQVLSQSDGWVEITLQTFDTHNTHAPGCTLTLLYSFKSLHVSLIRCSLFALVACFPTVRRFPLFTHVLSTQSTKTFERTRSVLPHEMYKTSTT